MSITLYPRNMPPLHLSLLEAHDGGLMKVQLKAVELRQAEMNGWFYIQPEVKGPMLDGPFLASLQMTMDLALRPDLIFRFNGLLSEGGDATEMLQGLAWEATQPKAQPDELLRPESWLCLGIEQERPHGPTGFRTLWHSVLPYLQAHNLAPDALDFSTIQQYIREEEQDEAETTWPLPDKPSPATPSPTPATDTSLFEAVSDFLRKKNLNIIRSKQETITYDFRGQHGAWNCLVRIFEEKEVVAFYAIFPGKANSGDLDAIETWINQVNQDLMIGNFEFDVLSGEIRFRISLQGTHIINQLETSWRTCMDTFDSYFQEMLRLVDL